MQYLTTTQWAARYDVSLSQVSSWILSGSLKYERRHGKRMIREDETVRAVNAPVGYGTVAEYCKLSGVPLHVVHKHINRGLIEPIQSAGKRWIPLSVKFEKIKEKTSRSGYLRDTWKMTA